PALDRVSLSVREGEFFGLLGPNGAGKTTLLTIVSGLLRPGAGRALLFGSPIGDPEARRAFALCPQELALYPSLTGRENLMLFGRLAGMSRDRRLERAVAVLAATGLTSGAD